VMVVEFLRIVRFVRLREKQAREGAACGGSDGG
jgi:hypothetical protein